MGGRVTGRHRSIGRVWPARRRLAVLVVLVAVLVSGCSEGQVERKPASGPNGGGFISGNSALTQIPADQRQPAPVVEGPALSGKGTVSTADYRGKVIVLNVWGSWCGPCRLEAPDLNAAAKQTEKVAQFVGINIRDTQPETARAFVRAFKVPYPHVYDPNGDQLLKFAGTLPPNGIPTTLVIDRQGRIAARVVGLVNKTTLVGLITDTAEGR